ncbi:MAG: hypothetical protein KF866_12100 [Phycisphaeraceae bacterium]|nr:hypothetical protein [Phycisphaeraceae bacterium]MCW5755276.1 hypothetical protein [Phycisphaeraceae bacterium]
MNQDHDTMPQGSKSSPHSILRDLSNAESTGSAKGRRLSAYVFVMAFVVVTGGGAIGVMRHMGLKSGIDLSGANLKYTAKHAVPAANFERVLHTLENSASPKQLPATVITIDPFRQDTGPAVRNDDRALAEAERARQRQIEEEKRRAADRARQIESKLSSMRVVSIMNGPIPIANISLGGKRNFVKVGDVIDQLFMVVQIEGSRVVVEVDGVQYTLSTAELMHSDDPMGGSRPSGR